MARNLTINAQGRVVVADNPATKYKADGRGITPTTSGSLALTEAPTGRVLPAHLIAGLVLISYRTRNAALITWTDRTTSLVITDSMLTSGMYGSPNAQGRYVLSLGNLRSTVPGVPAIRITATLPVLVYNMNLFGWGMDGNGKPGMVYCGANSNVRFEECMFFSSKPPAGYAGAFPGLDVVHEDGVLLEMVGCESHGTGGTQVATFRPPSVSGLASGGVRFERVMKINIDGRKVDANGNWSGMNIVNFVQLRNCAAFENGSYARDCIARNDPAYGAQFEDGVSAFNSYMKAGHVFVFSRFLVENALPYDPLFVASGGTAAVIGLKSDGSVIDYYGTGGIMGDQQNVTALTETTVSQGFQYLDSTILSLANYGAAIQAGHHNTLSDLTILSAGIIRSAAPQGYSRMAWTSAGALQSWNLSASDSSLFHDNLIANGDVMVAVLQSDGTFRGSYTPIWTPTSNGLTQTNNVVRPLPANPLAALAQVDAARAARIARWTSAGMVIGCAAAAPFASFRISTDPLAA